MESKTMDRHLIFFDGQCGLCHRAVRFAARADRDGRLFRFAPLGGETFERRLAHRFKEGFPNSVIFLAKDGDVSIRSSAVAGILKELGGGWRLLGSLMQLIPRAIRDWGYGVIAQHRHRVARTPDESCPIPSPELRSRFDP